MAGLCLVLAFLAVPAGHQVVGHRVLRKALRAVLRPDGPEVPKTRHELKHKARSRPLRVLADAAWLAYLGAVLGLAYVLR